MTASKQVTLAPAGALPLLSPRATATNFTFNFLTVSNQNYTVWRTTNLVTTDWITYTNFTADGFPKLVKVPPAESRQQFIRVSTP